LRPSLPIRRTPMGGCCSTACRRRARHCAAFRVKSPIHSRRRPGAGFIRAARVLQLTARRSIQRRPWRRSAMRCGAITLILMPVRSLRD